MHLARQAEEKLHHEALRWATHEKDAVPAYIMESVHRDLLESCEGYRLAMTDLSNIGLIQRAPKRLEEAADALSGHRFMFTSEDELQQGIAMVLGKEWTREHVLSKEDRIDFWHKMHCLGIEVKVDGSLSELTRQVFRYTENEKVQGVLVVTSLSRLSRLPDTMNGKPVRVLRLTGSIL
jgi:hypothetical protein